MQEKTCNLTALNTIVMWGFISFKLPVPGLISSMICLIIAKFTAAQKQISSAFTQAYVRSKACATFKWPTQVFLLYGGTLTSTYCSTTLLLGRAWWGLFGTCTSCTGAREILCLVSRWRQLIAAKPPRGGWGNFSHPQPPRVPNPSSARGGRNSFSVQGTPTFGNYLAQRKRR